MSHNILSASLLLVFPLFALFLLSRIIWSMCFIDTNLLFLQSLDYAMGLTMLTSQPRDRFERHVGFDNVPIGESSKKVPSSVVLTVKHNGYQPRRRSRTFMVGIDENPYSEYAVQWLLDELVDDGDEIICVRVIEKDMRLTEKSYYSDAQQVMDGIMAKNGSNRAVAFILEYAVGKLHSTFQSLVSSYECLFPPFSDIYPNHLQKSRSSSINQPC